MKNILITLFYADGIHGGVKYSAELGNYFHNIGYNVYCVGVISHDDVKELFAKNHVKFININDFDYNIEFDLIWAHHFPILPYLIKHGLKYKRVINSCISNILPIERLIWFEKNIDLYLCLDDRTKNMFIDEYNISENKIIVLPNTAPDNFYTYKHKQNKKLKNIAVVSNHAPEEIKNALKILKQKGYNTIIYGGKNSIDITPKILSKYDVIITIGKTVQYCLAMGIPVYNYDHFGGSGYISTKNIDVEESRNFSGRSFCTKKSADQIAEEIIKYYNSVLQEQNKLKQTAVKRYKLSSRISEIIDILQTIKPVKHITINNSNRLFFDYCEFIIVSQAHHIKNLKKESSLHRLLRHIKTMKF